MWFIIGAMIGYSIAQGEAESMCPDLSQSGCDKQQYCQWKPEVNKCTKRD